MDMASVRKWVIFFMGILAAILIADTISTTIVNLAGIIGWVKFVASFILYAVLFFGVLYALQKIFGIEFFSFSMMEK